MTNRDYELQVLNDLMAEMEIWAWERHPRGIKGATQFNLRRAALRELIRAKSETTNEKI